MSEITRQLERDAAFMKVLPYIGESKYKALTICEGEANRISNNLARAAREIERLEREIENCRLFAAKHRHQPWAPDILRFCYAAGVTGSPLRDSEEPKP